MPVDAHLQIRINRLGVTLEFFPLQPEAGRVRGRFLRVAEVERDRAVHLAKDREGKLCWIVSGDSPSWNP